MKIKLFLLKNQSCIFLVFFNSNCEKIKKTFILEKIVLLRSILMHPCISLVFCHEVTSKNKRSLHVAENSVPRGGVHSGSLPAPPGSDGDGSRGVSLNYQRRSPSDP